MAGWCTIEHARCVAVDLHQSTEPRVDPSVNQPRSGWNKNNILFVREKYSAVGSRYYNSLPHVMSSMPAAFFGRCVGE